MNIALVGCGFVADYYVATLAAYPRLKIVGVHDRDPARLDHFAGFHGLPKFETLEALLADDRVEMVLNLTNPRSHHEVSKAALLSGKHVYSEKPLAMEMVHARELVDLAEARGLQLASAPCSLLGETAQTLWKALREGRIGTPRVVYAEMDDGMVHKMAYRSWRSASGVPWPAKDEFEVGCTFEHAGYYLTWLPAFFGPATTITAFSATTLPDKGTDEPLAVNAPDFSVACVTFESGAVARLTCGIVAPHDHTLRIVGDGGVLSTRDCWFYRSPVKIQRPFRIRRRTLMTPKARYPLVGPNRGRYRYRGAQQMDFARGVAETAEAIATGRPNRIGARFGLHVNEMVIAISRAGADASAYRMTTTFDPIAPMPWAE